MELDFKLIPEKSKNKTGIYQLEINNKKYIGSTMASFKIRIKHHLSDLQMGKHHNNEMQTDFLKYGKNSLKFKVLKIITDKKTLSDEETKYIQLLNPEYNITKNYKKQNPRDFITCPLSNIVDTKKLIETLRLENEYLQKELKVLRKHNLNNIHMMEQMIHLR